MIHQCLHGYSDGHDLLATSINLTREQRTLLSQLSDLSGPAPVQGFDGYLSGFPLPGGIYVLAKTWYATELPRPGCVWTHSLLLTSDSLELDDIRSLTLLHRRPRSLDSFEEYSEDISSELESVGATALPESEVILTKVYGEPKFRICLPSESASTLEPTFMAVWNQQWPALRGRFTFTTGMLGSGHWQFDLQAIPRKNRRLFSESAGFLVIGEKGSSDPSWVREAAKDLGLDGSTAFRTFLRSFGADFNDGRAVFEGLSETFRLLSRSSHDRRAQPVYECIIRYFDKSAESEHLRRALFDDVEDSKFIDDPESLEVVVLDEGQILAVPDSRIRERASRLESADLLALVLRLGNKDSSKRASQVMEAFFERCREEHLDELPTNLLVQVLTRRPDLAQSSVVWRRPEERARLVLRDLTARGVFNGEIALGLLRSGVTRLLYEAPKGFPSQWIRAARQYVDERQMSTEIEEFVLGRLWESSAQLSTELRSHTFGGFLKVAAAILDVSAAEANSFPMDNADTRSALPRLHDAGAELRACAFLLMVGLVRTEPSTSFFVREGFSAIYQAAKEQQLPWDLWKKLEAQLPWHFLEWDRCARLIEGAVDRFATRSWPTAEFFRTFQNDEQFDRAVSALGTSNGRGYLRTLTSALDDSGTPLTTFQKSRLRTF